MARSKLTYFSFGGVSTRDYHIIVDSSDTLAKPTRDLERISIPGRSGGLTVDNGRFNDVSVTYHCRVVQDVDANFNGFLAALYALRGEQRLTDERMDTYYTGTYNGKTSPGCYRMAVLDTAVQAENVYWGDCGDFDITFTCKPQMWLNVGNVGIEVAQGSTLRIYNPTRFPSKPLLQLYGKGTGTEDATLARFTINGVTGSTETSIIGVTSESPYSYLYVDCDIEDAYNGASNCNKYIKALYDNFPECGVSNSGFVASVTSPGSGARMIIYPRWWTV